MLLIGVGQALLERGLVGHASKALNRKGGLLLLMGVGQALLAKGLKSHTSGALNRKGE
jgi:hypothetical protein